MTRPVDLRRLTLHARHDADALTERLHHARRRGEHLEQLLVEILGHQQLDPLDALPVLVHAGHLGPWSALELLQATTTNAIAQTAILFQRRKHKRAHTTLEHRRRWRDHPEYRACCEDVRDPTLAWAIEPNIQQHWRTLHHCIHRNHLVDDTRAVRAYSRKLALTLRRLRQRPPRDWLELWMESLAYDAHTVRRRVCRELPRGRKHSHAPTAEHVLRWLLGDDVPWHEDVRHALRDVSGIPADSWLTPNKPCVALTRRWRSRLGDELGSDI